ncbi:FAD-dependent monooxygenase [Labrys okinawensis]|uniref:FAD-dependent monooxygenase n=1 Tax=Labrys okinawensis TaxID=346911 RepID=UPI0039BD145C
MNSVTVLIVGAGPTGLLAAAELHRHGVDCLLIDAHDRPMEWDRATVVHPRSLEIFEGLGIVEPLLAAGVKQRKACIHAGGDLLGEIDLELCGSRYPFNIGISEEVTEGILTDYLARQGGKVTRAAKLVALGEREDGMLATIEQEGVATDVLAQWVIGCDGHHSAVRTLMGIEQDGHDIAEPWAVFDAGVRDWPHSLEANYGYLDEPPVILTALPDKRWRVYLRPTSEDSDLVADALQTLQRYLPTASFEDIANPTRFQCHTKVARQFRSGRVLLAGDAAHTCSPAQGHGMNSGLQDAFNLAWKLALVCKEHCSEALLDSYQAERRPVADVVMASGDAAESAQMVKSAEERRLRDTAIRSAFADRASRHHEAVAEAELDVDYGESPIVAGQRNAALSPGQRLPDRIEIQLAAGGNGMLHDYTNRRGHTAFLLIGASASDHELLPLREALDHPGSASILETTVTLAAHSGSAVAGVDAHLKPEMAQRLGAGDITLLLVRPDGHVGLRAEEDHGAMLAGYMGLLGSRQVRGA